MSTQSIHTAQIIQFPTSTIEIQLEEKLERYMELKTMASEFEALKKELKPAFEGTDEIKIGRFTVKGKYVSRKETVTPAYTYWDMRISG
jgi:hypothetical protein